MPPDEADSDIFGPIRTVFEFLIKVGEEESRRLILKTGKTVQRDLPEQQIWRPF